MNNFCVELKVCEGCGALFLRARGPNVVGHGMYCRGCALWLSEFPAPTVGHCARSREERTRIRREYRERCSARKKLAAAQQSVGGAR